MTDEAYIYEAIRTPRGRGKKGSLYATKPVDLVVGLIDELRSRLPDLDPGYVDDLVLGVVTPVGDQGGDIAKAAALVAGLPDTVGGVQVNRFCASGLEATNLAAQKVRSGWDRLVLAGGVESMSRVPMMSDGGPLFADPTTTYDHYFVPQGIGADLIATIEGFSREDVDAYAVRSQQRADTAWREGRFKRSIVPVTDGNGVTILDQDEHRRPDSTVATAPRWSWSAANRPGSTSGCSRGPGWSPPRSPEPTRRSCSPARPPPPARCWPPPASSSVTSTCSNSTRPSPPSC
jgi:acetyl-CoA C-acetyltransferase